MCFAAIVLLGLVSVVRLPMQELPDISPPYGAAFCMTNQQMSFDELERKIIIPIEGEIAQLPNVKNIRVWSGGRGAFFPIEFQYGTNVKYRIVDLQERLERFRRQFPKNSMFIFAFPFETSWFNKRFMDLVLKGPRNDPHLESVNADRIKQKLQDIDGIAQADIWGGKRRSVDVTVLQDKLREFGIPLWQVIQRVRTFANEPVFLGDIEEGETKYFVRLDGQFSDTNEIGDVTLRSSGNVAVRHLGKVENSSQTRRWLRRVDGKPALGMDLEKEAGVNPIDLSHRTRKVIEEINKELTAGYQLDIIWDLADDIRKIIYTLSELALTGVILSMFVLYLFIRNVKMTGIVCLVIPISIIATFNLLYFSNISLNIISLLGLAVGVGCLIDSSIVVLENIFRHHERGKNAITAALVGSREVGVAVFALTLTIVMVFLPIVFVEGNIRLIFREGALAIVFPMVISMLVALSFVPMATSRILVFLDRVTHALPGSRTKTKERRWTRRFRAIREKIVSGFRRLPLPNMKSTRWRYSKVLKSCLRHRVRFLIAIVLVVLYTYFYTMTGINQDVLKAPEDQEGFELYVYLPNGTKQDYTLKVVEHVEDILLQHVTEAKNIHAWVREDFARFWIKLKDRKERKRESPTIKEELRPYFENFTEAEVTYDQSRSRQENQPPPIDSGQGGMIEIRGAEYDQINAICQRFIEVIEQIPGVRDVISESEAGPLEYHFQLDRDAAALLQITPQLVAQSIQVAQRRGDYATIQMKKGDDEIDIIFAQAINPEELNRRVSSQEQGLKLEELKQVPIYSPALSTTVSLEELGTFQLERGMGQIQRENRERIGRIRFQTAPNVKYAEVESNIKKLIEEYPFPAGYRMILGGKTQKMDETYKALTQIVTLAVTLIYMCIASLFESFSLPLVIMLAVPLAVIGVVWMLILTGTAATELAGLGVIFLIGLLPNSAILLIHFSKYLRREKNFSRVRAVMVSAHTRLRPIFMTFLTTSLGLLPMAIPRGGDDEWVPFARTVIGGLSSSTILTLIIVPGFYFIVEDSSDLLSRMTQYLASWRWVLIFWNSEKREVMRLRLTAYRRKVEKENLWVKIDHLVRIYPAPRLETLGWRFRQFFASFRPLSATPGFIPGASPDSKLFSTQSRSKALDGVCLDIGPGLFGLLGPNGAGKTTLLRLIAGIDQPTRGFLSICGYDLKTEAKDAQRYIGYLPQHFGVYNHMTAYQYLDYFSLLKGIKRKADRHSAILKALEMVNLSDQKEIPVGNFSGGMKRRIGLAQIFLLPPKVLIVDEPTVGLDPLERVRFRNLLSQFSQNRVVILSTHIVEDVAHSCRNLALMDDGKVLFVGSPNELTATIKDKVWELTVSDRQVWYEYRRRYKITGQSHTSEGIRLRIISDAPPDASAHTVEPTLEDAYLYHTHISAIPDSAAAGAVSPV